jgi:hypothetical protein
LQGIFQEEVNMTQMEVISGRDLIWHAHETDVSEFIDKKIDIEGLNIVSLWFPHNGTREIRAVLLAKLRNSMDPYTLILTIPTITFKKIIRTINYEAGEIIE